MEKNGEGIVLTVHCIAYNQEKYIRQCLEGIVSQKTEFPFFALIYDDASTDGTAEIIREYESRYPHLIKGIYSKQNVYSREGFLGIKKILDENSLGTYTAYCEGDDFWTDCRKLQKQYEAAEKYKAVLCVHPVRCVRENGERTDTVIPEFTEGFVKSSDEFLRHLLVHGGSSCFVYQINSFFVRRDAQEAEFPLFMRKCNVFDVPFALQLGTKGTVVYLAEEMSCYRQASDASWTLRTEAKKERILAHQETMCLCFEEYKNYTGHVYDSLIDRKITETRFKMLLHKEDYKGLCQEPFRAMFRKISKKHRLRIMLAYYCPLAVRIHDGIKRKNQTHGK